MQKRWTLNPIDKNAVEKLRHELRIHPVLCSLLVQRGVTTYENAKHFFRPSLDHLHDPFLMKDMDKAVERLEQAIGKEKILIYGDYDVDGATSVALMTSFLKDIHPEIDFYIPDRYTEGYGISYKGIDYAKENGFSLIIALDCGITAIEQVAYAKSLGIDFIICDHHNPGVAIPNAVAVLDPKREDCPYPFKELSGCGVGFKLIQAYADRQNIPIEELENYFDLLVISIASDIVPITGENRTLAYFGLKKLNKSPRPGIKALLELAGLNEKQLTISDVVFGIGPRINAAGRMEHARDAVNLLLADDKKAAAHAEILNSTNTLRKDIDKAITEEALEIIEKENLHKKKTTVLHRPHWHKGVIGIVASRLIEHYHRPTIVLCGDQKATGSARSVRGFDIYNALKGCEELLEQFGGHTHAAGLSLKTEHLHSFAEMFEEIVDTSIDEELLIPEIVVDSELRLQDITPSFYNILRQMAPFGPGNMHPVFLLRNLHDSGYSRVVKDEHLKLSVRKNGTAIFNGIAFKMGEKIDQVKNGNAFDLCCVIDENEWNGKTRLELRVKDIRG